MLPEPPSHRWAPLTACHGGLSCVQVHYIMDEMLMNGCIVDTNKQNILEPVQLLENVS